MRFFPLLGTLLACQVLVGCESLPQFGGGAAVPAESQAPAIQDVVPPFQCPEPETVVCAEPEVKVVERVIERRYEKIVEVPVAKDKLVLGSVEYVTMEPGGALLEAQINTGAPTSTLIVREMKPFERDGDEWIRFSLNPAVLRADDAAAEPEESDAADAVTIELPIKRYVRVSRPGFERQRRPVVDMSLTVGEATHMVEVNITDRNGQRYLLSVGRNFLKDVAVVDVSRRHVQGQPGVQAPDDSK